MTVCHEIKKRITNLIVGKFRIQVSHAALQSLTTSLVEGIQIKYLNKHL